MVRTPPRHGLVLASVLLLVVLGTLGVAAALEDPDTDAVGPAADSPLGNVVDTANTSGYLVPTDGDPAADGYARNGIDVAGAVEMSELRLRGRVEENSLLRGFETAENEAERARLLRNDLTRLERATDRLGERYREVLQSHSQGSLSDGAFFRALARIDAKASEYESQATRMRTLWVQIDAPDAAAQRTRTRNVEADLGPLTNRVSDGVQRRFGGESSATRLYVYTTPDGAIVASIDDEGYHRVASALDQRDPDAPNQFESGDGRDDIAAHERAGQLYPWAADNSVGTVNLDNPGNTSVYRIGIPHAHGDLVTYIDGATTNVYAEEQTKRPGIVPISDSYTATGDGLELTVNTTAPTGPMLVTVTDTTTDRPVDAEIAVDGTVVGTTGSNGQLRVVQPRSGFDVTASVDDGSVAVSSP